MLQRLLPNFPTTLFVLLALLGIGLGAGTELKHNGTILFKSDQDATVGATYNKQSIQATVVAAKKHSFSLFSENQPNYVFLNNKRLTKKDWSYAADSKMFTIAVPAGSNQIHIRFDKVKSLEPFTEKIPVTLKTTTGKSKKIGKIATVGDLVRNRFSGSYTWNQPAGIYAIEILRDGKPVPGLQVKLSGKLSFENLGQNTFFLDSEDVLQISDKLCNSQIPFDQLVAKQVTTLTKTVWLDKKTLPWDSAIVVEGEDFAREDGGKITISTAHQNTHKGACAYSWSKSGHWVAWDVQVPKSGIYQLVIVGATELDQSLRKLQVDGKSMPGLDFLCFPGTGGWGRTDPNNWQPFTPVNDKNIPIFLPLKEGKHELRMESLAGQHLNVDAILLIKK